MGDEDGIGYGSNEIVAFCGESGSGPAMLSIKRRENQQAAVVKRLLPFAGMRIPSMLRAGQTMIG